VSPGRKGIWEAEGAVNFALFSIWCALVKKCNITHDLDGTEDDIFLGNFSYLMPDFRSNFK